MLNKLKKIQAERPDQKGFTIIEVMIVLAIAGLIILIVFLAVPALQRNSRNTQRKSDVGRISSAVTTVLSNNNNDVTKLTATNIANEAGTLGYYSGASIFNAIVVSVSGDTAKSPTAPTRDSISIVGNAVCNGTSKYDYTNRSVAIFYATEGSGATDNVQCIRL